jgi:hypothetical protein
MIVLEEKIFLLNLQVQKSRTVKKPKAFSMMNKRARGRESEKTQG